MRRAARRKAETFASGPIIDHYEDVLGRLVNGGSVRRSEVAGATCP